MAFLQLISAGLPAAVLHRKINRMWCLVPLKEQHIGREPLYFNWCSNIPNSNFMISWHKLYRLSNKASVLQYLSLA